jgi:hypothetical protein
MIKLCVIILSWNNKEDVLEAIRSLQESDQAGFRMQILVVDNGSSDDTPEAVQKLHVKVKKLAKNYGFAKGNNIGIEDALKEDTDYIALLNGDTTVDKNLIKKTLSAHQKKAKVGAISPKIYFAKGFEYHKKYKPSEAGKVIWYAGGKIDWENIYGSNRGVDEVDRGQFNETIETDFATGCFAMYKAEALKEVGLFDERYFAYMEDVDLSQRMKKKGWKIQYSPDGVLWHKVSQSSGIGSEQNDYYITRNRMLFGLTYAPLRTKFALIRESIKLLLSGRQWQKIGIGDYYLGRFGKGSWV